MYYGIPRSVVKKFSSMCPTCLLHQPQITKPPLQPIIANGFLSRLQVNLIFLQNTPLVTNSCFFLQCTRLTLLICGTCQMVNITGSCMLWTIGPSSILLTHLRANMHLASVQHLTATCSLTSEFPEFCIPTMVVNLSTVWLMDCWRAGIQISSLSVDNHDIPKVKAWLSVRTISSNRNYQQK